MSVRWKIFIPLAFFTIVINILLYGYINQQLVYQSEAARAESHAASLKILNGALTTSYHKLLDVAQTITALTQTSGSNQNQYVQMVLDYDFTQLEAQGILDSAVLFSPLGEQIMTWGGASSSFEVIVKKAIVQEYPVRDLVCHKQCSRYIAIPLLSEGDVSGVLVVGRIVQDSILDFKQLTGIDIGIAKKSGEANLAIIKWPASFIQITQKNQSTQLLSLLRKAEPVITLDTSYSVRAFGRSYGVFFTIPDSVQSDNSVWVLIADQTESIKQLSAIQFRFQVGMVVACIVMLLIIALMIEYFIKRLVLIQKQVANSPLTSIGSAYSEASFLDEIDQIRQLYVSKREEGGSLGDRGSQVISSSERSCATSLSEKEIISNLTGSSSNVVLTQCMDGQVLTMNELAKQLLGEFKGDGEHTFADCFLVGEANKPSLDDLNKLYLGRESLVCFEAQCVDMKGDIRYFYWINTNMESARDRLAILSIGIDITSNKKAEERLNWLAFHDPVTEVANKHFFLQRLPEMMASSVERRHSLAVMCCEVKSLTDNHLLMNLADGDVTLFSVVADRISSCLRSDDVVARFGDDLFMIILSGVKSKTNVGSVADKIISAFGAPFSISDCCFNVTINIGISIFPSQSRDVAELVQSAEVAMYLSKEEGANNFEYSCLESSLARS
jgi:diguanylate cyclase (GGDEF)-like protein